MVNISVVHTTVGIRLPLPSGDATALVSWLDPEGVHQLSVPPEAIERLRAPGEPLVRHVELGYPVQPEPADLLGARRADDQLSLRLRKSCSVLPRSGAEALVQHVEL